ncbi:hypothetical protein HK101_011765 [Irineochytrium annulatum]|nr:hypothetical protein HK101_011765 [Irineochytrium annulatum]
MALVRLILIDEVHILNEPKRGATLEVVISRMRTMDHEMRYGRASNVINTAGNMPFRIIAISATVANTDDIAKWLSNREGTPATVM